MCAPWKVVFLLGAGFIAGGGLEARAQTPTPVLKKTQTTPTSVYPEKRPAIANWQRFKGATRCEQVDGQLTCDNGYKATVR